jgi:hypothetical protein
MPVREDGGNLPPFFYQRNQKIIICVWFYRYVKIRSRQIVVASHRRCCAAWLFFCLPASNVASSRRLSHLDLASVLLAVLPAQQSGTLDGRRSPAGGANRPTAVSPTRPQHAGRACQPINLCEYHSIGILVKRCVSLRCTPGAAVACAGECL